MLHYETIEPEILGLLKKLQKIPEFSNLRLVGGTALALQIGHRKSLDIDLFGIIKSDYLTVSEKLNDIGNVTILKKSNNINIFLIDKIKVDLVNYHYQWLKDPLLDDGLILANTIDIAAMKLSAITGRGTKKDFIDLFFLLKLHTFNDIINFYKQKYPDGSVFLVLKSLLYFNDAEQNDEPVIMLLNENWENMKEFIKQTVESYLKNI